MATTAAVGLTRMMFLLRRGRKFVWFDVILEPCLAVIGGMLVWMICEVSKMPDMLQTVMSCLGGWGGPKTIHFLELRYLGDRRSPSPQSHNPAPPSDFTAL